MQEGVTNMEVDSTKNPGIGSHWIGELQVFQLKRLEILRPTFAILISFSDAGLELFQPEYVVRRVCCF